MVGVADVGESAVDVAVINLVLEVLLSLRSRWTMVSASAGLAEPRSLEMVAIRNRMDGLSIFPTNVVTLFYDISEVRKYIHKGDLYWIVEPVSSFFLGAQEKSHNINRLSGMFSLEGTTCQNSILKIELRCIIPLILSPINRSRGVD